ncbi:hypothetical protein [Moorena sp. SIO4G3]|uniref:hypothetical protein n=1 Tax=Moorena sp. SIO4G3 TaxID=2607821 RepID=UPI001429F81F|nr:hypothetical protein [Moorena sp. SIO4G3]NEO81898.1 hypothetical protein [Moorena sp. SIO4G3]
MGKSCDRASNSNLLSYRNFQQFGIITIMLATATWLLRKIPTILDNRDRASNSNKG